jgi:hypothetical protein
MAWQTAENRQDRPGRENGRITDDASAAPFGTELPPAAAVAGDTAQAAAVKVVTRTHKTLFWECTRCTQRLRHALRDYFPAALEAFEDLDATDTLELLARAPEPASAAKLTTAQISAALKRARRRMWVPKTYATRRYSCMTPPPRSCRWTRK